MEPLQWAWPFQFLFAYSLDYPVLLAEGTAIILFHPQGHAAIVEGMIAFSPNHWKRRKNMFQSHSAVQSTPTARFKLSLSNIYNHWTLQRQNRSSLIYPLRIAYYDHPDDSEFHHQAFYFLPNTKKRNAYILTFWYKVTGFCDCINTFTDVFCPGKKCNYWSFSLNLPQYQNKANALLIHYHTRAYHQILIWMNALFEFKCMIARRHMWHSI